MLINIESPLVMIPKFKLFLNEQECHQFSSTQINLPQNLANKVFEWGEENIKDENLYVQDDDHGREDELHITVLYGLHANSPDKVKELLKEEKPFEVSLGRVSSFKQDNFDVIKIDVFSEKLHKLNKVLNELPTTNKFSTYRPHITIAYVKNNSCNKLLGDKTFVGQKWVARTILFSSKCRDKTPIQLY